MIKSIFGNYDIPQLYPVIQN